jgi:hypothetical protein
MDLVGFNGTALHGNEFRPRALVFSVASFARDVPTARFV